MAKNFIKEHGEDRDYLRSIAMRYATTELSMAQVAEEYDISSSNVQTAIERSIVNGWIWYSYALMIRDKSDAGQQRHYTPKKSRYGYARKSRVQEKYDRLFMIRRRNIIQNCTFEEIRRCVNVYLGNLNISDPYKLMGYSREEMLGILMKGIFLDIITDKEYYTIKKYLLAWETDFVPKERLGKKLEIVTQLRSERNTILDRIRSYQAWIGNYSTPDSSCPYTLDQLHELLDDEEFFLEQYEKDMIDTF